MADALFKVISPTPVVSCGLKQKKSFPDSNVMQAMTSPDHRQTLEVCENIEVFYETLRDISMNFTFKIFNHNEDIDLFIKIVLISIL